MQHKHVEVTKETLLNNVIWLALRKLKTQSKQNGYKIKSQKYSYIDKIFFESEEQLNSLGDKERDFNTRLFALAQYCNYKYNVDFLNTITFLRFKDHLSYFHFEQVAKTLIRENSFASVVFWIIYRLTFKKKYNISSDLEVELKNKSLELAMKFK